MAAMVLVWAQPDLEEQHYALPPDDDVSQEWEGATVCGLTGPLRWVQGEVVDRGMLCERCIALGGANPPLQGDDTGPV